MENNFISVEVAYAAGDRQLIIPVEMSEGSVLEDAILQSGILREFPEIDLNRNKVGVFGKVGKLTQVLTGGDRVEIYRPLQQHPMEARRSRAAK